MSLRWQLINRLHLVELLKQRPELRDTPVERPILITGLFRTGTTFLHNVMAADSSYRVGRTWEFSYPVGRKHDLMGDRGWRRRRTSVPMLFSHFVQPELTSVHKVSADQQEEDFFLLENEIMMLKFLMGLGIFPYAKRMLDWPMREIYESHRTQLQILTAQGSGLPWLLKCPWHLWHQRGPSPRNAHSTLESLARCDPAGSIWRKWVSSGWSIRVSGSNAVWLRAAMWT